MASALLLPVVLSTPGDFACAWPTDATAFSLITYGDARISSHTHPTGLAIGGTLTDGTPRESGTVGSGNPGGRSWVNAMGQPIGLFHWKHGLTTGEGIPFEWAAFEALAAAAV